jgi:hypothetical protein
MEIRKAVLEASIEAAVPPSVRLHPNRSELYRKMVASFAESLTDPEIRTPAFDTIRGLIDQVTLETATDSAVFS